MGRYIFTEQDLEPFRALLENPIAQQVLEAAVPVKQLATPAQHTEEAPALLPVDVQSRDTPQGVPLHEILRAVREQAPSVSSMTVRDGRLLITHDRPPSPEENAAIQQILADGQRLGAWNAAAPAAGPPVELVNILTNPNTSDADWLHAFRQYAVAHLIGREQ
jgi:hypothetical protein